MPDYSKAKIYAIRAPGTDNVYIGSTTKSLSARMSNHRANYILYLNGKYHYTTSIEVVSIPGAYIELVEEFPCNNKEQLNKREGEIIRSTATCVNKRVEGRTKEEQIYSENHCQRRKEWLEANRERINASRRVKKISSEESQNLYSHPDQEQESSGHT